MTFQCQSPSDIKLLFVYKRNSQDPTQKSFLKFFPKYLGSFYTFCFKPEERTRFAPDNLKVSQTFINLVIKLKPTHIFMWLVYLNPEELEWCRNRNIKLVATVNGFATFSTGLYKSRDVYIECLKLLDIFFIPHEPHIKRLKELGVNAVELPFSFDHTTFKRLPFMRAMLPKLNKFFFVGNFGDGSEQSHYRIDMLKQFSNLGKTMIISDIKIHHKNEVHFRPIPYEPALNLVANLSNYLICSDYFPNINKYSELNYSEELDYCEDYSFAIRPRVYTMIGAGSPVIIERHNQLQRFFEDGKHLIMWSNYEELKAKVAYYDKNNIAYQKISQQALAYVTEYHTTDNRFREIILPGLLKI